MAESCPKKFFNAWVKSTSLAVVFERHERAMSGFSGRIFRNRAEKIRCVLHDLSWDRLFSDNDCWLLVSSDVDSITCKCDKNTAKYVQMVFSLDGNHIRIIKGLIPSRPSVPSWFITP